MINWILQRNLTKPKILDQIKSALNKDDETWEEVDIVPFSEKIPQIKNKDSLNIIYGSTTFMLNAFKDEELREGVFYDPNTFQMKNYVRKWKENILNHEGQLIKFGALNNLKSEQNKKWFIRPNHDGKEFGGRVDSFQKLRDWSKQICKLDLPDFNAETEIWISEPKEIKKEWRLFIVDDEIISSSRYMNNGILDESAKDIPNEMIFFAKSRIEEYRLHDIYVMDIAQIENEYKLIECNCFNGTGFYEHDIKKIIASINNFKRK